MFIDDVCVLDDELSKVFNVFVFENLVKWIIDNIYVVEE